MHTNSDGGLPVNTLSNTRKVYRKPMLTKGPQLASIVAVGKSIPV
jgi:hypothetical protein